MDEEIKEKLSEFERRIIKLEDRFKLNPTVAAKEISIKEFMLQKAPGGDVQKTLLIGYYLEKHRNFPAFSVKDLGQGFRDTKEPIPSNINDKVNKNIKQGYMMEVREKKDGMRAWVLTNSGERIIESNFKNDNICRQEAG
jgi:hypothetical protein